MFRAYTYHYAATYIVPGGVGNNFPPAGQSVTVHDHGFRALPDDPYVRHYSELSRDLTVCIVCS